MIQGRFTSLLDEEQTINHIKFITRGLFDLALPKDRAPGTFIPCSTPVPFPCQLLPSNQEPLDKSERGLQAQWHSTNIRESTERMAVFQRVDGPKKKGGSVSRAPTPIIDRINRNIYSRFKGEVQEVKQFTSRIRFQQKDSEVIWKEFLLRENQWVQNKRKASTQLAHYGRDAVLQNRVHLSEVQMSIKQLRGGTERLKARVLMQGANI